MSSKLDQPPPQFASVDEIRKGEADKSEPSAQEIARLLGADGHDENALADQSADLRNGHAETENTANWRTLRTVEAICANGIVPQAPPTGEPLVEWMEPSALLIEGAYQRDLSPKSIDLIRRIVERWDWRRFKPPIVAWTERGFEIIDGQHTAIAAATHPLIVRIPVLIVEAQEVQDRASAFIGHNRDRLQVSAVQMHRAAVAAGDETALTVQQIVDRAGARIIFSKHGKITWRPGDTVAVSAIATLADKRGAMKARQALELLVLARLAPIGTTELRAVDLILNGEEFADMDPEHLPATIASLGDEAMRQAKLDAKTHCIPIWQALGRVWFRKCRKKRKAA